MPQWCWVLSQELPQRRMAPVELGLGTRLHADVCTEGVVHPGPPLLPLLSLFPNHLLQLFLWCHEQGEGCGSHPQGRHCQRVRCSAFSPWAQILVPKCSAHHSHISTWKSSGAFLLVKTTRQAQVQIGSCSFIHSPTH